MRRRARAVLAVLVIVAAVALMVRLSWWQWERAQSSGRFLNYSYAVEWLMFAGLTVFGVVRLVLEDRRRSRDGDLPAAEEASVPAGRGAPVPVVGPPLRPGEELEEISWVRLRRSLGLGEISRDDA